MQQIVIMFVKSLRILIIAVINLNYGDRKCKLNIFRYQKLFKIILSNNIFVFIIFVFHLDKYLVLIVLHNDTKFLQEIAKLVSK